MKILTGSHVRQADLYTIEHEPVSSIDLMERASIALTEHIVSVYDSSYRVLVFAGKGNNGGDGLAIARLLTAKGYDCEVIVLFPEEQLSEDCRINLNRLPVSVGIRSLAEIKDTIYNKYDTLIVDAVLGTGVKGRVHGTALDAIRIINSLKLPVVSIDLPSGLPTDLSDDPEEPIAVQADTTLTIEFPKLSLLVPETGRSAGRVEIVPIGISEDFKRIAQERFFYVDRSFSEELQCRARGVFSHKGSYGHTLLICGCRKMMGAALLATSAALRSGCGLVTAHIPESGCCAMNIVNPSAMVSMDPGDCFTTLPEKMEKYTSVCIGCGMGTDERSAAALQQVLQCGIPMVIDADAINILSIHPELLSSLPSGSVLTPHPGELRRLIGDWNNAAERVEKSVEFSVRYQVTLLIKGAYTMTIVPSGRIYVNSTGSPAMAKGGSGDVLAGYIAGLISRGYTSEKAALLGVYRHGEAGEKCAAELGTESMNSSDILDYFRY